MYVACPGCAARVVPANVGQRERLKGHLSRRLQRGLLCYKGGSTDPFKVHDLVLQNLSSNCSRDWIRESTLTASSFMTLAGRKSQG